MPSDGGTGGTGNAGSSSGRGDGGRGSGEGGGNSGGSSGGNSNGNGGGYSGGGLSSRGTQAGGTATGLGNTGLGSGNTSKGADSSNGGGLRGSNSNSSSGLGLGLGGYNKSGDPIGNVGASTAAAGAIALGASASAQAVQPSAMTSFVDTLSKVFSYAAPAIGIATATNPIGLAMSSVGLAKAVSATDFGSINSSPTASIGGLNFGGTSIGSKSSGFSPSGGSGGASVSSRNPYGGLFNSTQPQTKTTPIVSPLIGGLDTVSLESGGDVKTTGDVGNVRENSTLIKSGGFDIMSLIIPAVLFAIFKG